VYKKSIFERLPLRVARHGADGGLPGLDRRRRPPDPWDKEERAADEHAHTIRVARSSVADLTAQGYLLPAETDDPANGGNGNGLVCAHPIGYRDPADPTRQIYLFADDRI
jgi:hypothetical protein